MVRCSLTHREEPLSRREAFLAGWSFVELQLRGQQNKYRVYSPEVTVEEMFEDLHSIITTAGQGALEATVHHIPLTVEELKAGKGRDVPARRRR